MRPVARRAFTSIALVIGLLLVLVLMGFSGALQVSTARTTLERIYARRLLDVVANSAVEEACARIEATAALRTLPLPTRKRDLGREVLAGLGLPRRLSPELTRQDHRDDGITIGDVELSPSTWYCEFTPEPGGTAIAQELAIFEFRVPLTAAVGSTTLSQVFTMRRYVDASPDPGQSSVRLKIQPNNMALRVR